LEFEFGFGELAVVVVVADGVDFAGAVVIASANGTMAADSFGTDVAFDVSFFL
jgi:hypothetical protein